MTRRMWLYAGVPALSVVAWGAAFVLGATREVDPIGPAEFVWAVSFLPLQVVGIIVLRQRPGNLVGRAPLVVAALFGPVRRRVQAAVERRFNRARFDGVAAAEAFATRLRDPVDVDRVATDLVGVVSTTLAPTTVSVWVRESTHD